jgi:hypothetical protein
MEGEIQNSWVGGREDSMSVLNVTLKSASAGDQNPKEVRNFAKLAVNTYTKSK